MNVRLSRQLFHQLDPSARNAFAHGTRTKYACDAFFMSVLRESGRAGGKLCEGKIKFSEWCVLNCWIRRPAHVG